MKNVVVFFICALKKFKYESKLKHDSSHICVRTDPSKFICLS